MPFLGEKQGFFVLNNQKQNQKNKQNKKQQKQIRRV